MHKVFYKLYFLEGLDFMVNAVFVLALLALFISDYNKTTLLKILLFSFAMMCIIPNRYLTYSKALIEHDQTLAKYEKQYIRNKIKKWEKQ